MSKNDLKDESVGHDADDPRFETEDEMIEDEGPRSELDELRAERDELLARYQRSLADFQNFQRRSRQNEDHARWEGKAQAVRAVLAPMDHLELALAQNMGDDAATKSLRQGIELVRDEFIKAMGLLGVVRIDPAPGDEFDPGRHEAMLQVESEEFDANCVAQQMQAGWAMGEYVIRPAKVSVTKSPAGSDGSGEDVDDDPEMTED